MTPQTFWSLFLTLTFIRTLDVAHGNFTSQYGPVPVLMGDIAQHCEGENCPGCHWKKKIMCNHEKQWFETYQEGECERSAMNQIKNK